MSSSELIRIESVLVGMIFGGVNPNERGGKEQ